MERNRNRMSVASKASSYYSVADAGKPQPPSLGCPQPKSVKNANFILREPNHTFDSSFNRDFFSFLAWTPYPSPYQKKTIKLLNHLSKDDNTNDISKRINSFQHVKQLLEEGFDTDISQAVDFSRQLLERGMVQVRDTNIFSIMS